MSIQVWKGVLSWSEWVRPKHSSMQNIAWSVRNEMCAVNLCPEEEAGQGAQDADWAGNWGILEIE